MIKFNNLLVTEDNKCLIIDVQIEDLQYLENVTIESIWVDTQDTWVPNGPSQSAAKVFTQNPNLSLRQVRLTLSKPIVDGSRNNMYFVYVKADVSNAPEYTLADCSCGSEMVVGVAVNLYEVYKTLMKGVDELNNNCNNDANFIDLFLRLKAIQSSIITSNYPLAIKYWKQHFIDNTISLKHKSCGCHGRP